MTPVKVLHVMGRMDPGGAELRLIELIEHMSPEEFQVDVCVLSGLRGTLDDRITARGGTVIPMSVDRSFPARFLALAGRRRYDVVHSHVLLASGGILALAAMVRVPVRIAHFHAMHDQQPSTLRRRLRRRVTRCLLDMSATDIVACGEGAMDAVWDPGWRNDPRCQVVYDALDPSRFEQRTDCDAVRVQLGIRPAGPVFMHIANVAPVKNHSRLLSMFAAIHQHTPSAVLVLVGAETDLPDGPIARQIRASDLDSSVVVLGVRDDIPRLLAAADVLLLPSLYEGLPGVVLEACLVGIPVLATDLPGVREIATRLKGVYYLPLAETDSEWARLALALPKEAERLCLRRDAMERFGPSVFHIDRAVEAHRELWRGTARERA